MTTLVAVALTFAVYAGALRLQRVAGGHPLANPTLLTIVAITAGLRLAGIHAADFERRAWPLSLLLLPATVALGVPLAANLPAIRGDLGRVVAGVLAGLLASAVSAAVIVDAFGGGASLARTMVTKSATTPIAMSVADAVGGDPALAASFALASGLLVALLLRPTLSLLRVRNRAATGLAAGVIGSGMGAATVAGDGAQEAAFAATGVGLTGLATALLAPLLCRLLQLG